MLFFMLFSLFLLAKVWRTHVKCFARTICLFQGTTFYSPWEQHKVVLFLRHIFS